jgi:hypothetical protein
VAVVHQRHFHLLVQQQAVLVVQVEELVELTISLELILRL